MMSLLETHNPGRLHHVDVDFSSPPVSNDSAAWLREERVARTLLLDYSLHFLDLACMFSSVPWELSNVRFQRNARGQTSVIQGAAKADYSVQFLLRQGFAPRRARMRFTFQNYSVSLGFFPDTFVPYMSQDNAWLYKREARVIARATRRKVFDKLRGKDSDPSHARVFAVAGDTDIAAASSLTLSRVRGFYELLFQISDAVYDS
jgi:predicted dehydrogenase